MRTIKPENTTYPFPAERGNTKCWDDDNKETTERSRRKYHANWSRNIRIPEVMPDESVAFSFLCET